MKIILLILYFSIFFLQNSSVLAQSSCARVLSHRLLGFIEESEEGSLHFVLTDARQLNLVNKEVGILEYSLLSDGKTLYISWMDVNPLLRSSGISQHLVEELFRKYPQTRKISGYLTDTNLNIYQQNYKASHDPVLALKATPFYRTFSQFGFSVIQQNNIEPDKVIVVLERK